MFASSVSEGRRLHSLEAEESLLGYFMLNNSAIYEISTNLSSADFYEPILGRLYGLMLTDAQAGRKFNALTLSQRLGDAGIPNRSNHYLANLSAAAFSVYSAKEIADEIIEMATQRRLKQLCHETLAAIEQNDMGSAELAAGAMSSLNDITAGVDRDVFLSEKKVGRAIYDRMQKPLVCTSTGFQRLDVAMGGGLYPGCAYGFMARYKMGKTALAGTISDNLSHNQVKHLYLALEMGAEGIHERKLARRMKSPPGDFRHPDIRSRPDHLERIDQAIESGGDYCYYANVPGCHFDRLQRICAAAVYRLKIGGLILDYWQLVGGQPRSQSRADHLENVAQWVAEFVKKHGIWAIVLGQINQNGNTRGSEGSQLAFDQVYDICRQEEGPQAWLECRASRYTAANDVGTPDEPAYEIMPCGPYFAELKRLPANH